MAFLKVAGTRVPLNHVTEALTKPYVASRFLRGSALRRVMRLLRWQDTLFDLIRASQVARLHVSRADGAD
jgi:hypothetical protein